MGRTGRLFCHQHWGLEPDIITLSKALSGGYVPVGAVLTTEAVFDAVYSSMDRAVVHSSTFSRNELLHEVRGMGLMVGLVFGPPSSRPGRARFRMLELARKGFFSQLIVVPLFHRHRILTQVSADHLEVIKLIPPLIIGEAEVDSFVNAFTEVMDDAHNGSGLMWDFGKSLIKQTRVPSAHVR